MYEFADEEIYISDNHQAWVDFSYEWDMDYYGNETETVEIYDLRCPCISHTCDYNKDDVIEQCKEIGREHSQNESFINPTGQDWPKADND